MIKFWIGLCFPIALFAAPVLTGIQPRGAQRGKAFTMTLTGRDLSGEVKIVTTLPAVFTPLSGSRMDLPYLVELKPGAAVGTYPIRLQTSDGISNILLFTVGSFPEIDEDEPTEHSNDSIATAQPVKALPVTVNGTLKGADRDIYRVSGKAGEMRVFEIEARRCGSAIDPVIGVLDAAGKQLARNEDAAGIGVDSRLAFTFPRDGDYFVEVHDARFSKQEQNFYRLKMGAYPYADSIFPLGGRHGESVEIEFTGGLTGKRGSSKATVKLPAEGEFTRIAMPGSPTLPFLFALSDYPELRAPVTGPISIPAIVNGRIEKPGAVEKYHLAVTPGESFLFEIQARELETSRLDAVITVYDGKGRKLASAGDIPPAQNVFAVLSAERTTNDPFLNFKVPPGLEEIVVAVEDLAQRGGPDFGYRLIMQKQAEQFLLSSSPAYLNIPRGGTVSIQVTADRRGYDGPIQVSVPDLPKGLTAEGGYIAAETVDPNNQRSLSRRGVLSISAAPDATLPQTQLVLVGEGKPADGSTLRRLATGPGMIVEVAGGTGLPDAASSDRQKPFTANWLGMTLPVSLTAEPPATLAVAFKSRTPMEQGDAYNFEWTVYTKRKDLKMPARVIADTPGVRDVRVINMKVASPGAATGTFTVTTTKATTPARYDLAISATIMVNGQNETIVSRPIAFQVVEGSSESDAKVASAVR